MSDLDRSHGMPIFCPSTYLNPHSSLVADDGRYETNCNFNMETAILSSQQKSKCIKHKDLYDLT